MALANRSGERLIQALHRERNPIRVARILVDEFGLEQRQLAVGCGVSESSVSEWLSGPETRSPHQRDRVLEIAYVVVAVLSTRSISVELLREWLVSPMDYFLVDAPLAAIAAGRCREVSEIGKDFAMGKVPM